MGTTSLVIEDDDDEIAVYQVSEDGVNWRPYNAVTDRLLTLHRRIEFAPPASEDA